MANEIRVRANNVNGTLSVALSNVDTTMSSAGLSNLPTIDTTNYAAICIENEIVWVTGHTASATTATILRAQESTSAATHSINVAWQHGPTAFDGGTDWTPFTPTLTQSATVTKTVTYAKYCKISRIVTASVTLSVTGAGTASNNIAVGLPVTSATGPAVIGAGYIYDSSAGFVYKATVETSGGSAVLFRPTTTTNNDFLGSAVMTAALGAGDLVVYTITYESLA